MEIINQLQLLGIKETEAKIYLGCLEIGETNLAQISTKTSLPRSTVKYALEKLSQKGLLEIISKKSSHIYFPHPPRTVLTLLKNKKSQLEEQIDAFSNSLPELNQRFSSSSISPKVRYFNGSEIKKIYEEILDSPIDETLFIGEMKNAAEVVGLNYLKSWMKRRSEAKIKTRVIRVRKGEFQDDVVSSHSLKYLRTVRLAPKSFESPNHIIIYGNNVASISTTKESFGFVITSKEYTTTMKNFFKEVWKNSTPL